ncbi:uncharacterized protein TNCV_4006701 [Trichonephila clavipes]|nr:uncharacterized protein TNCV_4006701 [Trichonephila clavipes]
MKQNKLRNLLVFKEDNLCVNPCLNFQHLEDAERQGERKEEEEREKRERPVGRVGTKGRSLTPSINPWIGRTFSCVLRTKIESQIQSSFCTALKTNLQPKLASLTRSSASKWERQGRDEIGLAFSFVPSPQSRLEIKSGYCCSSPHRHIWRRSLRPTTLNQRNFKVS